MQENKIYTNELINETSPYLLQHAHNPVNWFPWGEKALNKAIKEDKPILVSIGYSACHWCHVMERESFENEEVALIMNTHFINIKIDREERLDIDQIYMDAVQAMSGSGGWPLNVFLTPTKKPFYGGTYFPPIKAHGRSSWTEVLLSIAKAFKEKRDEVEMQSQALINHLIKSNQFGSSQISAEENFTKDDLNSINQNILNTSDKVWGGFGNSPKFPQTGTIQFLLNHYYATKNEESLQQAVLSLNKIIQGGIYDHLQGGFARYSTDAEWLVPHFEKMLYDNALLIQVLSAAYSITKNELYLETMQQTIQFVQEEWMNDEGGFYSAYDADSNGVEGEYYVWSKNEIDTILLEDAELFSSFFDVTEQGNWEHSNILWMKESYKAFAKKNKLDLYFLKNKLNNCKIKLLNERVKRNKPLLDTKILTSWNALMNTALCKAYASTGNLAYKNLALKNIQFIEKKIIENETELIHVIKSANNKINGFLDDYAYLIQAYILLQEITGNQEYLKKANELTKYVLDNFHDADSKFFFYTPKNQKDIIVQKKDVYDGATPSGNSIMAFNLLYLSKVLDKPEYKKISEHMVYSLKNAIIKHPTSFSNWAFISQLLANSFYEVVIVGENYEEKLRSLLKMYLPFKVVQSATKANESWSLLNSKPFDLDADIYLCINSVCYKPIKNVNELGKLINS